MKRFADKVVIVTGAGHGIGQAIAERFSAEGAKVAVNDLHQARAEEVAKALPGDAMAVQADISSKTQVDEMFDAVIAKWGTVDILVNNAGNIYADRHFLDGDEAWWDGVQAVNLQELSLKLPPKRRTSWCARAAA